MARLSTTHHFVEERDGFLVEVNVSIFNPSQLSLNDEDITLIKNSTNEIADAIEFPNQVKGERVITP